MPHSLTPISDFLPRLQHPLASQYIHPLFLLEFPPPPLARSPPSATGFTSVASGLTLTMFKWRMLYISGPSLRKYNMYTSDPPNISTFNLWPSNYLNSFQHPQFRQIGGKASNHGKGLSIATIRTIEMDAENAIHLTHPKCNGIFERPVFNVESTVVRGS